MENEYAIVTNDGRILQKDNAVFQGKELAIVDIADADEALRYFKNQFAGIEKYAETCLESIREEDRGPALLDKLQELREQVLTARAVGDFETLVARIDDVIRECAADASEVAAEQAVQKAEEKPVPLEKPVKQEEAEHETKAVQKEKPVSEAGPAEQELEKPVSESKDGTADSDRPKEYPESLSALVELADKADEIAQGSNWQQMQSELDNIRFKWDQILEEEEVLASETGHKELEGRVEAIREIISERKAEWLERRRQRRKDNLDKRAKIIDQLQDIIERKKWQSFKQVANLSNRWEEIKDVPKEPEALEQEKKYEELIREFNDKKVAFLVRKAQKEEENMVGKLAVLDKLNQVISSVGPDTENWEQRDREVEEFSRQWRKIGHVPGEHSDTIWERFKSVRDQYFTKKMEYNKDFRIRTMKNIRKKTQLCELAEALMEEEDLAVAVREINNLHKKWKKIAPIPKEKNDELWERFNEATQKFNQRKSENLDLIREQEQENFDEKASLCEKAEALSDRTDWSAATAEMDALMKAWKEAGPVPRRKAGKLWKRFKKAMDSFYDARRRHFKVVRDEQKENYERKKEIVAELEKLGDHENPEEVLQQTKQLQDKFRDTGFVPIKKKQKIEKEYKDACDRIYQRYRGAGRKAGPAGDQQLSAGKSLRPEYFKLKKECDNLYEEIMRYRDTKTFINPGGKGNDLIEEIEQKIENSQRKLDSKLEKLEELRQKMED